MKGVTLCQDEPEICSVSLTIACVLSKGPEYNYSHVERLEQMVSHHVAQPYDFVCLDDSPFPHWWAKTSLFEPGRFKDRVLYLDLDVTVVGSLDDLADFDAPFVIIKDWREMRGNSEYNSSVMAWTAGAGDRIFTEFNSGVVQVMRGDQNFIQEIMYPCATFPEDWCVSYKVQTWLKSKTLPQEARVVIFHGKPKPWSVPDQPEQWQRV